MEQNIEVDARSLHSPGSIILGVFISCFGSLIFFSERMLKKMAAKIFTQVKQQAQISILHFRAPNLDIFT